ncbi:MAG TPA: flagellar hook-basal body complex protein FliE [Vicinamibacterales bacterium]
MPISPIGPALPSLAGAGATTSTSSAPGSGTFADSLGRLVDAVKTSSGSANDAVAGMLNGSGDVHDAMIALQRADLTLQLTVQVRNKLVDAYQQIMQMPV